MRALLIVLDSVGCGHAPDADAYGDRGANTLGHILEQIPSLKLPQLFSLGLGKILGFGNGPVPSAAWGRMQERSAGKDTTTGHWEIAGALLEEPFSKFEQFPPELIEAIEHEAGVEFLGNYPRSGTVILDELGAEHLRTRKPILYTSADSVLQIAAHDCVLPADQLDQLCRVARRHADQYRIGRVISRPFTGDPGSFQRTSGRHDYSMVPPRTVLNALKEGGWNVESVGKISDIFAGSGITRSIPTKSNREGMQRIDEWWSADRDGLLFVNLVDFDTLYGHRRDVSGYAKALEEFDQWLGAFLPKIHHQEMVLITADHGNDPTFRGTDHTREEVPLLAIFNGSTAPLGIRRSYADIAATLSEFFLEERWNAGESFLETLRRFER